MMDACPAWLLPLVEALKLDMEVVVVLQSSLLELSILGCGAVVPSLRMGMPGWMTKI